MKEDILQYIWQFGHFDRTNLQTTDGLAVQIYKSGFKNTNQGPDFAEAKIKIDNIDWAGNIEIHIQSSDWNKHGHSEDYENVILHVVYENDAFIEYKNGKKIPTLELKNIINKNILTNCNSLLNQKDDILCAFEWHQISNISKISMYDRVLTQRLERKAEIIQNVFKETLMDWEQTSYQILLQNMGFKTNADAFGRLAQLLPFKIIQKNTENRLSIEALLYGVGGFLSSNPVDEYQQELKKVYDYLKIKYNLQHSLLLSEWKFFRLRPSNFPTVKLGQLAGILQNISSVHSQFLACKSYKDVKQSFEIKPLPYWQKHYNFGKISKNKISNIGSQAIENVIINTICQIKAAYGIWKDEHQYITESIQLLESLPAEDNFINRKWETLSFKPKNAYDSQAQIELYNNFCLKKKCLSCSIGNEIINKK
ncbi:MAG: DUF2851 family protein [Cytophagales bacterium]|nr:MAG: DUF2851 family protein [Cytophagales bacterium]